MDAARGYERFLRAEKRARREHEWLARTTDMSRHRSQVDLHSVCIPGAARETAGASKTSKKKQSPSKSKSTISQEDASCYKPEESCCTCECAKKTEEYLNKCIVSSCNQEQCPNRKTQCCQCCPSKPCCEPKPPCQCKACQPEPKQKDCNCAACCPKPKKDEVCQSKPISAEKCQCCACCPKPKKVTTCTPQEDQSACKPKSACKCDQCAFKLKTDASGSACCMPSPCLAGKCSCNLSACPGAKKTCTRSMASQTELCVGLDCDCCDSKEVDRSQRTDNDSTSKNKTKNAVKSKNGRPQIVVNASSAEPNKPQGKESKNSKSKSRDNKRSKQDNENANVQQQSPSAELDECTCEVDQCPRQESNCCANSSQIPRQGCNCCTNSSQIPRQGCNCCANSSQIPRQGCNCCANCSQIPLIMKNLCQLKKQLDDSAQQTQQICLMSIRVNQLCNAVKALKEQYEVMKRSPPNLCCCKTDTKKLQRRVSSMCQFCCNKKLPILDKDLHCALLKLINGRKLSEIVLTVLLRADNVYHVNVRELNTGNVLGCILVSDAAIEQAIKIGLFKEILTFCVIDVRNTLKPKDCPFGITFEFVKDQRISGGRAKYVSQQQRSHRSQEHSNYAKEFTAHMLGLPLSSLRELSSEDEASITHSRMTLGQISRKIAKTDDTLDDDDNMYPVRSIEITSLSDLDVEQECRIVAGTARSHSHEDPASVDWQEPVGTWEQQEASKATFLLTPRAIERAKARRSLFTVKRSSTINVSNNNSFRSRHCHTNHTKWHD